MSRSRASAVFGACAIGGAAALWLNGNAHPPLADPSRCPGLIEWSALVNADLRPAAALGPTLIWWHHTAAVLAAMLCALAAWRFTRSLIASATVGVVIAASPFMTGTLAPPAAIALALAAAAWGALLGGSLAAFVIAVAAASAVAPNLAVPGALLCCWSVLRSPLPHRSLRAIASAILCLGAAVAVTIALPALPGQAASQSQFGCVIPGALNLSGVAHAVTLAFAGVGPLAMALAALGLVSIMSAPRDARAAEPHQPKLLVPAWAWPAAALVAMLAADADPLRTLPPLVIGFWLLAGRGLVETIGGGAAGWRRRTGGGLVILIHVATTRGPRLGTPARVADAPLTLGHETLTRHDFQSLLYQLPPGSGLIAEDAITDVFLRSLSGSLVRARNDIRVVSRTADAAGAARRNGRVFALPRAQTELQTRGVQLIDGLAPAVPGVAEVAAVLPCDALDATWRTSHATSVPRWAIVSNSEPEQGPLVIYFGSATPLEITPVGWPTLALRGFVIGRYDRNDPRQQAVLDHDVSEDAAPTRDAALSERYVTRAELWRVPGAPLSLTAEVSPVPSSALAADLPRAFGTIRLCPSFPFTVRAFRQGANR